MHYYYYDDAFCSAASLSFIITLAKVVPVVERWDEGKSDLQVNDR